MADKSRQDTASTGGDFITVMDIVTGAAFARPSSVAAVRETAPDNGAGKPAARQLDELLGAGPTGIGGC